MTSPASSVDKWKPLCGKVREDHALDQRIVEMLNVLRLEHGLRPIPLRSPTMNDKLNTERILIREKNLARSRSQP